MNLHRMGKQIELLHQAADGRGRRRTRQATVLRVVLVVDSLQLTDVQVPHSLQPLQLRLDLRLLLRHTKLNTGHQ